MRTNIYILAHGAFILSLFLIVGCANRHSRQPVWVFFPIESQEHSGKVYISEFPESVDFYFCASNFVPDNATLTEIVENRSDVIPFSAHKIVPEEINTVVFIEDCSGSMVNNIHIADSIIHSAVRYFPNSKVGLIRIGKSAIWAQPPIDAENFYYLYLDSLKYPKPNGTSLAEGLTIAAEDSANMPSLIIVLADGSVSMTQKLSRTIEKISSMKIPIVSLQVDGDNSDALRKISARTNGYFSSVEENSIEEIVFGGWHIEYSPFISDTNGAEHTIILRWESHRRIAKYTAPGTPKKKEIETAERTIPPELITGIRIPFMMPDNAYPISETEFVLDSLVQLINTSDLPGNAVLRVDGYTCDLGTREHNYELSLRRAKVVANYVRQNAKIPIKFEIYGHGEDDPLMPNTSERNRMVNRRAEARIVFTDAGSRVQK